MGSVSSPRALPIYIFTLAHGFIPLLDTPLCVPPWAKRPMIAHTYHNKEWTVLDLGIPITAVLLCMGKDKDTYTWHRSSTVHSLL